METSRQQMLDPAALITKILSVTGSGAPLHEPEFIGNEREYVADAIDSGWVSSGGDYVTRLEQEMSEFVGSAHAASTVNGTAALHAALLLGGVERDDEVIIPTLTFVGTANAVSYLGAVPHLADSEYSTLGLDPEKLDDHLKAETEISGGACRNKRTGRRIGAVVCMHTFGHAVDLDSLTEVCARHRLVLIEDAAESLGSYYRGRHTGTVGKMGILSFNGNKVLTAGGGGMILTNDPDLGSAAKHITTTAKVAHPWRYDHDRVGFNYRLPNLNAALACAQLELLPRFLSEKRALADRYAQALANTPGVALVTEPPHAKSNYWLNALLLDEGSLRDAVLTAAHGAGLIARPAWTPMHRLPMYEDSPRMDLSTSEDLFSRLINLPSSPKLGRDQRGEA